ncbi:MAG: ADOP family duplicated permease [Candidatus Acidiferrales bacterium]|jgi:predicted permease
MPALSRIKNFFRNIFAKHRADRDLDDEVRSYADLLTQEKIRAGANPDEARRTSRLELGGVEQVKEQVREARAGAWLDSLFQDLRYGAHMLRKNPGFTAVAVLTLALGIGANVAIFTLTYAVILESLPVPNPQQLVRYTFRSGAHDFGLSGPLYDALRKHEDVDQDLLAWGGGGTLTAQEDGLATNVEGELMSGNGFRVLELQPFLGRFFSDADDQIAGGPNGYQAVLSYPFWKQHFHADTNVVGRSLSINGTEVTVIGVLPAGFQGVAIGQPPDIILPLSFEEILNAPHPLRHAPGRFWLTVIGRLKPGASLRLAEANLRTTEESVRADADPSHRFLGGFFATFRIGVERGGSGRSFLRFTYGRPLVVLEILVGLVLLLCCANTALLVLARVSSRLREFAVRSALGASRRRLFRQAMCEVGLVTFFGLMAGIALGWAGAKSLVAMLAAIGQPPPLDAAPQAAVFVFTAGISVLSALAAGAWPAVRASRVAPILGLKEGGTGSTSKALGRWIVPVQVAVSVVLMAAASLLGTSFFRLLLADSGFRPQGVVLAAVNLMETKVTPAVATQLAQQIVDTLGAAPGVDSAAVMSQPPLHGWWSAAHYYSLDQKGVLHPDMQTWQEAVSADYFATIGTPILKGRGFARADIGGAPVCVLSASAAQNFFPGEETVGRFVFAGGNDPALDGKTKADPKDTCRVIGVAADAHFQSLHQPPERAIYQVVPQNGVGVIFFVLVRSSNAQIATTAIRSAVRKVAPAAPAPTVFTFNQLLAEHLRQERMLMALSACFAAVALLLTALGLYGLLSRNVVMRTKEIGLRLALGAHPRDALSSVLWQGLRLVILGSAAGLIAAFGIAKLLRSLLIGVQLDSPVLLIAAVAAIFVAASLASCIPAWRAARVDPMEALRYE